MSHQKAFNWDNLLLGIRANIPRRNSIVAQNEIRPFFYSAASPLSKQTTMEIDATTETIMTDEVMTEQPPAAAAAAITEMEDDAPPARLMITKMVCLNHRYIVHRHHT